MTVEKTASKGRRNLIKGAAVAAGAMTARGQLLLGEDKPAEASPVLGQSWR